MADNAVFVQSFAGECAQMENPTDAGLLRNVYLVDDDERVIDVVKIQLTSAGYDVRAFSNSSAFLESFSDLPPGVVVTDQRMPEYEGLEVLTQLVSQARHRFRVILLTGYPETRVAVQAMQLGAVTVLDKPFDKAQLIAAIELGFQALDHEADEELDLPPLLPDGRTYLGRLSEREREVIDRVYKGETNKAIAIGLQISIKTVEKHRGKAMKKMEVGSLAALVRLMRREYGLS